MRLPDWRLECWYNLRNLIDDRPGASMHRDCRTIASTDQYPADEAKEATTRATTRIVRTGAVLAALIAAISLSACTTSKTPEASSGTEQTTSETDAPSRPTTSISATQPAPRNTGIAVISNNSTGYEVGFIDPAAGTYRKVATYFDGSGMSSDSSAEELLSHDLSRFGVYRQVRGTIHVGWLDKSGAFTDVTPEIEPKTPFGAAPPLPKPLGFDTEGNFYFEKFFSDSEIDVAAGTKIEYYKLPPGKITGAEVLGRQSYTGTSASDGGLQKYGIVLRGLACSSSANAAYLGSTEYVDIANDQIYRVQITDAQSCHQPTDGTPLLPGTNSSTIGGRLAVSPDGEQIAFKRENAELWTVPANGGQPKQVNVSGIKLSNFDLVEWN